MLDNTQTVEEVKEELSGTDKEKLVEYIFNQATIINNLMAEINTANAIIENNNIKLNNIKENAEQYFNIAVSLQSKINKIANALDVVEPIADIKTQMHNTLIKLEEGEQID